MSASEYWLSWSGACALGAEAANAIQVTTTAMTAVSLRMSRRLFTYAGSLSMLTLDVRGSGLGRRRRLQVRTTAGATACDAAPFTISQKMNANSPAKVTVMRMPFTAVGG